VTSVLIPTRLLLLHTRMWGGGESIFMESRTVKVGHPLSYHLVTPVIEDLGNNRFHHHHHHHVQEGLGLILLEHDDDDDENGCFLNPVRLELQDDRKADDRPSQYEIPLKIDPPPPPPPPQTCM